MMAYSTLLSDVIVLLQSPLRLLGTYPHPLHSRHSPKRPKSPESPHCFEGLNASCPDQGCYEVYKGDLK